MARPATSLFCPSPKVAQIAMPSPKCRSLDVQTPDGVTRSEGSLPRSIMLKDRPEIRWVMMAPVGQPEMVPWHRQPTHYEKGTRRIGCHALNGQLLSAFAVTGLVGGRALKPFPGHDLS